MTVREAGLNDKFVRITGAPFETSDADIRRKFETYGKITAIRREKYASLDPESSYFPVFTGAITVRMIVKTNIPSIIMMCGTRVQVNYQGQPKTCFKCGKTGHIGANCTEMKLGEPRFPGKWAGPRRSDPSPLDSNQFPELIQPGNTQHPTTITTENTEANKDLDKQSTGDLPQIPHDSMDEEEEEVGEAGAAQAQLLPTAPLPNAHSPFMFGTGTFDYSQLTIHDMLDSCATSDPSTTTPNMIDIATSKTPAETPEETESQEESDNSSTSSAASGYELVQNKRKNGQSKNNGPAVKEPKTAKPTPTSSPNSKPRGQKK